MKIMRGGRAEEIITLGVAPGELLLETVWAAVKKLGIRNGVVVSGIGTLKTCHMHHIDHDRFPPRDIHFTIKRPLELLAVSGLIANGEPHLHIVVSHRDKHTYGGHLEDKSEVLYMAEIAILKCNSLKMTRVFDPVRRIKLLTPHK